MLISMKKSYRKQVAFLILVCLIALPLQAGVIPGRWEKVSTLPVASPITVELKNGDLVKGDYEALSASQLELVTDSANAAIPKENVKTVTTQPKDDLLNGAFIGAGVGAGLMGALSMKPEFDFNARGHLYFTAIGAAIGLGIGALTDAVQKPVGVVLYKAPENR